MTSMSAVVVLLLLVGSSGSAAQRPAPDGVRKVPVSIQHRGASSQLDLAESVEGCDMRCHARVGFIVGGAGMLVYVLTVRDSVKDGFRGFKYFVEFLMVGSSAAVGSATGIIIFLLRHGRQHRKSLSAMDQTGVLPGRVPSSFAASSAISGMDLGSIHPCSAACLAALTVSSDNTSGTRASCKVFASS
jgi:hypothetical protein